MERKTTDSGANSMNAKLLAAVLLAAAILVVPSARAAVQGIIGPTFNLSASADYVSQPDGASIYSWGYGCTVGSVPVMQTWTGTGPAPTCPQMQLPGPTLIVHEGDVVTVNLTNALPPAAGNTSIVFPGFTVTSTGGVAGIMAQEASSTVAVSYSFTATKPGTYAYYSGTQADLQIEMGLFGAIVVLPASTYVPPTSCVKGPNALATTAYDHADSCYDREYLFQFSEIDSTVHDQVLAQVQACPVGPCPQIVATMEPYRPNYFLINGRSFPDDTDAPYAGAYPHQPYNGNPQIHPGEKLLMRVVGQGRWQHPFHFHGNHARVLARDGNMLLSTSTNVDGSHPLGGPLLFTIPTVSGQSVDAIFMWTGKGLNWDVYNHTAGDGTVCVPDANGYYTTASSPPAPLTAPNYGEWCADHDKPIPVTPPDPTIVANGQWYGGTPYIGLSGFNPVNLPPGTLNQNPGAGYAYMWHSHNEREITTNDVFPGGMLMMMIVDPPQWKIDETQ
jgi:FtsP/CotA-like multicopper oxidase with cupredoxin domain